MELNRNLEDYERNIPNNQCLTVGNLPEEYHLELKEFKPTVFKVDIRGNHRTFTTASKTC